MKRDLINRIENFIAEPQCETSYQGDFAVGFEMRRGVPKHWGGGIWFSDVAVTEILAALRTVTIPPMTQDQIDYLQRIHDQTGKYDPTVMVGGPDQGRRR